MPLKLCLTAPMTEDRGCILEQYIAYIGTNATGENGGIRVASVNPATGALSIVQHLQNFDAPAYPAISHDRMHMLSGLTNPLAPVPQKGMLAILSIAPDGTLSPINAVPAVCQNSTCHVCFSPDKRFAYAAHYFEGRTSAYAISSDASLWGPIQLIQHEGCGPTMPFQTSAHVHYCRFTPDGKYLCCVDLGLDIIRLYKPDEYGQLSHVRDIPVVHGAGARHLVFSPDGKFCYVVSELASLVTTFSYNDGEFFLLETVSTQTVEPKEEKSSSAIRISPDGRFLFIGNRFVNNISVFKLEDGIPRLLSNVSCLFPRDLNILPNGKFLYVCGQRDDAIEIFSFNSKTGELIPTGERFTAPIPTCIEFLSVNTGC